MITIATATIEQVREILTENDREYRAAKSANQPKYVLREYRDVNNTLLDIIEAKSTGLIDVITAG